MLIRRFTFTVLTFIIFVIALYCEGMLFQYNDVSRETKAEKILMPRSTVSHDGNDLLPDPSDNDAVAIPL